MTALHFAAGNGHADVCKEHCKNGVRVNVKDTKKLNTPLHAAPPRATPRASSTSSRRMPTPSRATRRTRRRSTSPAAPHATCFSRTSARARARRPRSPPPRAAAAAKGEEGAGGGEAARRRRDPARHGRLHQAVRRLLLPRRPQVAGPDPHLPARARARQRHRGHRQGGRRRLGEGPLRPGRRRQPVALSMKAVTRRRARKRLPGGDGFFQAKPAAACPRRR